MAKFKRGLRGEIIQQSVFVAKMVPDGMFARQVVRAVTTSCCVVP
jgi:hypothetical protein